MPVDRKSKKPAQPVAKKVVAKTVSKKPAPAAPKAKAKPAVKATAKAVTKPTAKPVAKTAAKPAAKPATKAKSVPASKPKAAAKPAVKPAAKSAAKPVAKAKAEDTKKKVPAVQAHAPKASAKPKAAAKKATKAKGKKGSAEDDDLSDIEADLEGEPVVEAGAEKAKPLRMKISKAKERALMKEFGLDETVLSEEDMQKRRQRLKTLIKLGKTRGYLTHGEISDHLPDKLVDAETLEVVISMLNDMGVAVYEHTPDAETLLLNNNTPTAATEEEAEEEAEAALSTVDSEFGRTTDPVRMYMREMGTVELLTREGE
ncbi:MAG: putative polymerase sigma-70 factor, partial [Pseudomonadota bacterium]